MSSNRVWVGRVRERAGGDYRSGWYVRYTDENGRRKREKAGKTKSEAISLAKAIEQRLGRYKHAVANGVDSGPRHDATWPVSAALAMFAEHQRTKAKAVSDSWIKMTRSHIDRACKSCGWQVVGSINRPAAQKHLAKLRSEGLGNAALNRHRAALRSFTRWLASEDGANLPVDPLRGLKPYDEKSEPRRTRRALTDDEKKKLLAQAESSDVVRTIKSYRYKGELTTCKRDLKLPNRATLYRLALGTGLRAGELASLKPSSFDLDGDNPCVRLSAASTKNRKAVRQPMRKELAAEVREVLASLPDVVRLDAWLWPDLKRAAEVIQADCKAAGIEVETGAGRIDFHSLRHTFITDLVRAGVHPKMAQLLARHSSLDLTMQVYTHISDEQLSGALEMLGS